jgi:hypothetical protein
MQQEHDFAARSPWTRPGFVIAAAFAVLVIAAAVAIAVWPSDNGPHTAAPTPAGTSPAGDTTPTSVLPTAIPSHPPADVTWQLVGQSAVPVSRSAGPHSVAGGTASGYAHTPSGALIAAAQLLIRAGHSAGKASWEPSVIQQFVAGADRNRLLAALRSAPASTAAPGELSPLAGYIYQSYTPDTAVIGLVYRAPGAGTATYHVVTTTLVWRDGDWRMVAPPGGSWLSVNRQALDLTGVTAWGAA